MQPNAVSSTKNTELPTLPPETVEPDQGLITGRRVAFEIPEASGEEQRSWSVLSGDEKASIMLKAGPGFALISGPAAVGFGIVVSILSKIDSTTSSSKENGLWSPPVLAIAITITALFSAVFFASVGCVIYGAAHRCRAELFGRDEESGLPEYIDHE